MGPLADSMDHLPHDDDAIARDVALVGSLSAVPHLLSILCEQTGMGFAAVARVDDGSWTACAVLDKIGFGLKPGGQLPVESTLCREARAERRAIVIDQASLDPIYARHHTPRIYNIESYVSVPIVLADDVYFGNLCAIDPKPANVSRPEVVTMFTAYAELIARQLDSESRYQASQTALLDAQAAAELREHFIAVLGHDLRNPLSAISMLALLLERNAPTVKPQEVGTKILASARRMARLIDDVMDYARARLGGGIGVQLTAEPDLASALKDVVRELQAAHPDRTIIEHIEIGCPIVCDRGRIQQLLSNLMGNAFHHGSDQLPVSVRATVQGPGLVIEVSNGGDPIPAENLLKIFQPYWRPASSKPGGGLGLGLHICYQIVQSHGGTLAVTSTADAGTTFVANIPTGREPG